MAFDTKAVLTALVTLVDGLAITDGVHRGAPESITERRSAIVTVGSQRLYMKATGLLEREARYFVEFASRVDADEGVAENDVADFLDQFQAAFYVDPTIAGTCADATLDFSLADDPSYQPRAGQEFRVMPVIVVTKQRRPRP